jgi:DNA helicase HerA-like ATPase
VRAALPDAVAGLADALPSLRTGEALVSGEAIALPTRVLFDRPDPEPYASDPSVDSWRGLPTANQLDAAVARWRGMDTQEEMPPDGLATGH